MEIKASGVNNKKALKALSDIHMYKRRGPKKTFTLRIILFGLILVFMWAMVISSGFDRNALTPAAVYTALCGLWWLYLRCVPALTYRHNGSMTETVNRFTFTDDYVQIKGEGDGISTDAQLNYEKLYKVWETTEYMFLYINKSNAYIVDRSTLSAEDFAAVKERLVSILGKKKYILCKY